MAVQRYQEGQALLAQRPAQHRGLEDVGAFDLGIHIHVAWDLKERGAVTLRDLEDWSEAELRGCRDFGPKNNPLIADFKRLREEAKSAAKRHVQLKEAIEERATATRRIAELVAMDEPAGKVIQFPARLH